MKFFSFFIQILLTFIGIILLFNQSIDRYVEQKYHVSLTQDNDFFQKISQPAGYFSSFFEKLLLENPSVPPDETIPQDISTQEPEELLNPKIKTTDKEIIIKQEATFLLIGDSMMQGVGITLIPELKKRKMKVISLAKQSTGLTYDNFFNWPKTLKETLEQEPEIDIIVVMLGANDPWNIKKTKFGTPAWDEIYLERIRQILAIAKEYDIPILWYEVPLVRNKKLSDKIPHLNELYQQGLNTPPEELHLLHNQNETDQSIQQIQTHPKNSKFKTYFIQVNTLFSPNNIFTSSIELDGKNITIRSNDGIHFSLKGSYLLTQLLLDHLQIDLPEEKKDDLSNDTEEKELPEKNSENSNQKKAP